MKKVVLQKFIADSGYCSRRRAEELIVLGKVMVNCEPAILGYRVDEGDEVYIGTKKLEPQSDMIYVVLNKPIGYTCTSRNFKDEKNVFDLVRVKERLFVVGRLDKDSRGLVLLTNDGDLTQKLTHPKFEHEKIYKVRVEGDNIDSDFVIKSLKRGVDIGEEGVVGAKDVKYLGGNDFLVVLTEGKKRQIRRMFQRIDFYVSDLIRVGIGNLELGGLAEGEWKYINRDDIKLKNQKRGE